MQYEIYGYNVPFTASGQRFPIFTTTAARDAFLSSCLVGKLVDAASGDGYDFNPRQSSLTITESAAIEYGDLIKVNYIRARVIKRYGVGGRVQVQDYYYFAQSLQGFSPQFESEPRTAAFNIAFDALAMALNEDAPPRLRVCTPIQISSVFDGILGATANDTAGASFPLSGSGDTATATRFEMVRDLGESYGGGADETLDSALMFVGIFSTLTSTSEGKEAGALVLARPLDFFDDTPALSLSLSVITSVSKVRPANIQRTSFTELRLQGQEDGKEKSVQLLRAFVVPRGLLPQNEVWQSAAGVEYQSGYIITGVNGEWWLDDWVTPAPYEGKGLIEIPTKAVKQLYTLPSFDAKTLYDNRSARAVYVDIGTPTTRLQIPAPTSGKQARVDFSASFNLSGYNLIMSVGATQINLGGDFEIPVPYNEAAASMERNKWSVALQGVSHIGGIVGGIVSQNPLLIGGALLSAGQFVAGVAENLAQPAIIQGQGNGEFTAACAALPAYNSLRRGAVYVRYFFDTPNERAEVARFGYKWRAAFVNDEEDAVRSIFLNDNADGARVRYIKTAGAAFDLTPVSIAQTEQLNASLSALFDRGVTLVYNPESAEEFRDL